MSGNLWKRVEGTVEGTTYSTEGQARPRSPRPRIWRPALQAWPRLPLPRQGRRRAGTDPPRATGALQLHRTVGRTRRPGPRRRRQAAQPRGLLARSRPRRQEAQGAQGADRPERRRAGREHDARAVADEVADRAGRGREGPQDA